MSTKKKFSSRFITSILIFMIVVIIFLGLLYMSGIPYFSNLTPCLPPPWVSEDGVATAQVYIFYDANQNGAPDEGERPLPKIRVELGTEFDFTGEDGATTVYLFKENCVCKCSRNETLKIEVPNGWSATTPTQLILTGNETVTNFGLIKN